MTKIIDMFGLWTLLRPVFLVSVIGVVVVYFLIIGRWRQRFTISSPVSKKQITFFLLASILLYVTKGPIDAIGHVMFSVHMTEMAVLYLIIPPLFILGIPSWFFKALLNIHFVKNIFSFFASPLLALLTFNGLFSFYHVPLVFDYVKQSMIFHPLITILLFFTAFMMWWPLLNKLAEWQSLTPIKKIGYIFANGVLLTPACALIIFADTPLYATYYDPQTWANSVHFMMNSNGAMISGGSQVLNPMPLVDDQQLGGVMMKIIQEIVYGSILAYVFFQWVRQEREKDEVDLNTRMSPQPAE